MSTHLPPPSDPLLDVSEPTCGPLYANLCIDKFPCLQCQEMALQWKCGFIFRLYNVHLEVGNMDFMIGNMACAPLFGSPKTDALSSESTVFIINVPSDVILSTN